MLRIRRRLRLVAASWLALQLALLAFAPTSLCLAERTDGARPGAAECTCAHGDGQMMCPMHHGQRVPDVRCSCRSVRDPLAAVVAALWGPAAILTRVAAPLDLAAADSPQTGPELPIQATVLPDLRPPRA